MSIRQHQHVTIFELMELVAAIALARWMADKFSNHFGGAWHTMVFWVTAILGTAVLFLCFLYAVSWLFQFFDRQKTTPREESKSDAS